MAMTHGYAPGLSSNGLKWFALIFMCIDHIGALFEPIAVDFSLACRIIGRAAAPIFAFVLVQSFLHTRCRTVMENRLLHFAIVAQIPYSLFGYSITHEIDDIFKLNVIFTFYLTFQWLRRITAAHLKLSFFIHAFVLFIIGFFCDWGLFIPCWCYIFLKVKSNILQLICIFTWSIFIYIMFGGKHDNNLLLVLPIIGLLISIPFISYFNGTRGRDVLGRYFFYWFYAGHLLLLSIMKLILDSSL